MHLKKTFLSVEKRKRRTMSRSFKKLTVATVKIIKGKTHCLQFPFEAISQTEFLSFDHLRCPLREGSQGASPGRVLPDPRSPAPPQKHAPTPSLPLHFFIYEYVARIPMSYLFCGPVNFPTEALSPADSGSSRNSEKKRPEQKNSFQLFFFFF